MQLIKKLKTYARFRHFNCYAGQKAEARRYINAKRQSTIETLGNNKRLDGNPNENLSLSIEFYLCGTFTKIPR